MINIYPIHPVPVPPNLNEATLGGLGIAPPLRRHLPPSYTRLHRCFMFLFSNLGMKDLRPRSPLRSDLDLYTGAARVRLRRFAERTRPEHRPSPLAVTVSVRRLTSQLRRLKANRGVNGGRLKQRNGHNNLSRQVAAQQLIAKRCSSGRPRDALPKTSYGCRVHHLFVENIGSPRVHAIRSHMQVTLLVSASRL